MKNVFKEINYKNIFDFLFISLLLLSPIVLKLYFSLSTHEIRDRQVGLISLWLIGKSIYSKPKLSNFNMIDIGVFLTLLIIVFHFTHLSEASIYYSMFWCYLSYFLIYLILRWIFTSSNAQKNIQNILILIILSCIIQSILSLFQYLTNNPNDEILGSFISPNFLGIYLCFGFLSLLWFVFVKRLKNKRFNNIAFIGLLVFGFFIFNSGSRGSWVSLMGGSLVLLITSKKNLDYLKVFSIKKYTSLALLFITTLFIGYKSLYNLSPDSVDGRTLVSKITVHEILKKPLQGHGLFSFPGKYNKAKSKYFETKRSWSEVKNATYVFSPFNDFLLIAFELGIIILLVILCIATIAILKIKLNKESRIGLAILATLMLFALSNSPSNNVLITFIGILGFTLISTFSRIKTINSDTNLLVTKTLQLIIIFVGCLGLYGTYLKTESTSKFKKFKHIKKPSHISELVLLSKLTDYNFYSEYVLGMKLYKNGYKEDGKNYISSSFIKNSSPKVGKQLALCYMNEKNFTKAEEIFRFNIYLEPYRYEARMDLLNLLIKTKEYNKALNIAKEVIELPIKIPSEKVLIYKKKSKDFIMNYKKSINH